MYPPEFQECVARWRKLSVADPLSTLPDWLLNDYCVYCEPNLAAPVGLLEPAQPQTSDSKTEIEPLTDRRGEDAMVWFRDESVVARMRELIQAYSVDSTSADTLQELAGLRRVLAQLWLDVEPVQLQTLEQTAVGEVTRAMIRSGFSTFLQGKVDIKAREQLAAHAVNLSTPGAEGCVVAALLLFPPGNVQMESLEGLPNWLIDILREHMTR